MKTVYRPWNTVEAHHLVDYLGQHGIKGFIRGEDFVGLGASVPPADQLQIEVAIGQVEQARRLIAQWEAQQSSGDTLAQEHVTQSLDGRSMFARTRSALLWMTVGISLGVAAFKLPITTGEQRSSQDGELDEVEQHSSVEERSSEDGELDEVEQPSPVEERSSQNGGLDENWQYSPAGDLLFWELDRNADGAMDFKMRYNAKEQYELLLEDTDFDGVFETTNYYKNDLLSWLKADTDGDGFAERREYYVHEILDTIQYVDPVTRKIVRVTHHRGGYPTHSDVDTDRDGKLDTRETLSPLGDIVERSAL